MDKIKEQISDEIKHAYSDFYNKCCVPCLDYVYDDNCGKKVYSTAYAAPALNNIYDVHDCCEMFLSENYPEIEFNVKDFDICLMADKRVIGNENVLPIALTKYAFDKYLATDVPVKSSEKSADVKEDKDEYIGQIPF